MKSPRSRRTHQYLRKVSGLLGHNESVCVLFPAASRSLQRQSWKALYSSYADMACLDHVVAVTDQSLIVIRTDHGADIVSRGAHLAEFEPLQGMSTTVDISDRRYWVSRYWHSEMREARAFMMQMRNNRESEPPST